jgi:hypothetical protein
VNEDDLGLGHGKERTEQQCYRSCSFVVSVHPHPHSNQNLSSKECGPGTLPRFLLPLSNNTLKQILLLHPFTKEEALIKETRKHFLDR